MKASRLSDTQLKKLHKLYVSEKFNITQAAKDIGVARNTLKRHIRLWCAADNTNKNRFCERNEFLKFLKNKIEPGNADVMFGRIMAGLVDKMEKLPSVKQLWIYHCEVTPNAYSYSQFAYHYADWLKSPAKITHYKINMMSLSVTDTQILNTWRRSNDRRKWEKAVVVLDTAQGHPIIQIAGKIERSPECVRHWINIFKKKGLVGLEPQKRQTDDSVIQQIKIKKENLIRLLHEAPQLHGFNRTSWRLKDLSTAYYKHYGASVSMAMISMYIRQEGYVFRKARKVLTSPDPEFREKLAHIQTILQNLTAEEKFFSIDEYGPFSIKMKGGRALVKHGEFKTYPQHQQSKGCLICTAALELSTNQMTHFYSRKKDTAEMIKMIEVLCGRYNDQDKLYLSWDAAIWHASKKLNAYLDEINAMNYRAEHHTPVVELAPLPASAQFLNVIESVFSGLAKSVIHHSDYASVGHCQAAIDRYFYERNQHFALHPKKAGKKIWGKERTVAEFRDSNNCKDPAWR
ncbi:MAG: IS630 family transposase [Bacteroidota bacterium]